MQIQDNPLIAVKNSYASLINLAKALDLNHPQTSDPRKRTGYNLLHILHIFGKKQFDFFEKGLAEPATDPGNGFLLSEIGVAHSEYPIDYPFQVINNQIANDIEVITRAINNREMTTSSPQALTQIKLADQLAYLALQLAIAQWGIGQSTVLTYFQKSPSVRVIPYAPVAIVGIPLKAVEHDYDLLATPHEIGHYVYWRSLFPTPSNESSTSSISEDNFRDLILQNLSLLDDQEECARNWFEEIFADVYGCLIAGPISAIYMQDMLSGLPTTQLTEDDADHPLSLLRPAIYTETLKQMAEAPSTPTAIRERLNQAAEALEAKWQERVVTLQNVTEFAMLSKKATAPQNKLRVLTTAVMEVVLREVVRRLCQGKLVDLVTNQTQSLEKLWYRGLNPENGADLPSWHSGFSTFVNLYKESVVSPNGATYPELEISVQGDSESLQLVMPNSQESLFSTQVGMMNLWFELKRDIIMGNEQDVSSIPENPVIVNDNDQPRQLWHDILDANGWATQGPGPGHVGKG